MLPESVDDNPAIPPAVELRGTLLVNARNSEQKQETPVLDLTS
jgi:hypothetical protein